MTATSTTASTAVGGADSSDVAGNPIDTGDVAGFEIIEIRVGGAVQLVARADNPELRQRGLMFVEDLGDLDGMLFVFDGERFGGFWMKNTLIALDIAFFDGAGGLVGSLTMEPCRADPCPTYDIGLAYRYALEAPAGALGGLAGDARLEIPIDNP